MGEPRPSASLASSPAICYSRAAQCQPLRRQPTATLASPHGLDLASSADLEPQRRAAIPEPLLLLAPAAALAGAGSPRIPYPIRGPHAVSAADHGLEGDNATLGSAAIRASIDDAGRSRDVMLSRRVTRERLAIKSSLEQFDTQSRPGLSSTNSCTCLALRPHKHTHSISSLPHSSVARVKA